MPKGNSDNGKAAADLPVLVDHRLMKALSHVVRQHILVAAAQDKVSPKELSELLGEGLSQVSYHVTVLHRECDEMLELVGTKPRRGAVEHYYRASARTLFPAKAWRRIKKGLRGVVGGGLASDLFNDLAGALKAGKLKGAHDFIARTPLVLDKEGQRKVKAIAERAAEQVEAEQRATSQRMAKANGSGAKAAGYSFGVLAFETAWEPEELHGPVEAAEPSKADRASDR